MANLLAEDGSSLLWEDGGSLYDESAVLPSFPSAPLDLRVELDIAGTWTYATSQVYQREGTAPPIIITRGRPDESSQVNPSSATFELNNRGGLFSPKNPLGPFYGQFGRNTPVRLSVPAQSNYLRLEGFTARAYVNDTGSGQIDVTGSIDLRIQLDLSDWQGCILAAKLDGGACWYWILNPNGTMGFAWFDSGAVFHASPASTVPVPFTRGMFALRVTMDATTGNVTYYTGTTVGGTWAQLGAVVNPVGAATSIASNFNSPLVVGYSFGQDASQQLYGRVAEFQMYSGIAGTLKADAVFFAQSAGSTGWTDAQGNLWLLTGGSEISARDYRYHGECSALPPKWDTTGVDQSVQVTAGGIFRRLGQGRAPVRSPIRRAISAQGGSLAPVAYWPCEEAAGATSFGSATGGALMTFDGSPNLATDNSFACSSPLPQVNGSRWHGRVGSYSGSGSIVVRFLMKVGTLPASKQPLVRLVTSGTATDVTFSVDNSGFGYLAGTSSSGSTVFSDGPFVAPAGASFSGTPGWLSIELRPSGGTVNVTMVMLAPGATSAFTLVSDSFTGTVGNVTDIYVNPSAVFTDTVAGHFSVQSAWVTMFSLQQPLNGWQGELAASRFARLCGEAGLTARVTGSPGQSAPMGQQAIDTLMNLLQSCEDADQGQMYEPRSVLGLGFRTLASICNQPARVVIDYSQAQLGGGGTGLAPTYDDQRVRNDSTVTRATVGNAKTGASYQYQLNDGSLMSITGVGDYQDTLTADVATDSQVPNLAGWRVHVGTVDEARWPVVPFNLRRAAIQGASLYYPLLAVDIGDYAQVLNLPGVIVSDPARQLAWGLKESLGGFHHVLELNAVPESPYEVLILDDPVYGHADTDGSQLAASVTSTATTLQVATTGPSGILWTTAAGDLPFDIAVSGERMTVTAITGSSSPQAFTVTRSVNGVVKAQAAGTDVRLFIPPVLAYQ